MKSQFDLSDRNRISIPTSAIPSFTNLTYKYGTLSASGIIFPAINKACTIRQLWFQSETDCVIQLQENGQPIGSPVEIPAKSVWRFAGKIHPNNVTIGLLITPSVVVNYQIDWSTDLREEYIVQETSFFPVASGGGGVTSDVNLIEVGGSPISLGQNVEANSIPVVIASDQSTLPIAGVVAVSNFPATQSISGAVDVTDRAARLLGHVSIDGQPIAISAAALPLPANAAQEAGGNLAALATHQTDGTQKTQVTNFPATQPVTIGQSTTSPFSHAAISFAASGDNTIVVGVALQTIRAFRLVFVVSGATNIIIKNGAGTNLTGAMAFTANGSFAVDDSSIPEFITSAGNALIINSSNAVQVSGYIDYTQS